MRHALGILLAVPVLFLSCGTEGGGALPGGSPEEVNPYEGIVLNEAGMHDELQDAVSFVEIMNVSQGEISLDGLDLYATDKYLKDQRVASLSGHLAPGARLILDTGDGSLIAGLCSDAVFTLTLKKGRKGTVVDTFTRPADAPALGTFASWQRIPDGNGEWKRITWSSLGRENSVFDLSATLPNAVWVWGSHMAGLLADDARELRSLKEKGFDHILLNAAAFNQANSATAVRFISRAAEIGIAVHAWMQCFYENGSWINPILDEQARYDEAVFSRIREEAREYIEQWGVQGIHLDYIRFGGTASKHNPSAEVNAKGAVERVCREIRQIADAYGEGIVTSAALMPEMNSTSSYGQDPAAMGRYLHVLMPMIYRYSYGYSDADCRTVSNWFADKAAEGGAVSWSGMTSYRGNDSGVTPMDAEGILSDARLFAGTRASGIVIFRYALGSFPDVSNLWN